MELKRNLQLRLLTGLLLITVFHLLFSFAKKESFITSSEVSNKELASIFVKSNNEQINRYMSDVYKNLQAKGLKAPQIKKLSSSFKKALQIKDVQKRQTALLPLYYKTQFLDKNATKINNK